MTQGVLSFTVASSDERLIQRTGEVALAEYYKAIGIDTLCTIFSLHLKVTTHISPLR